jgi:hypothetical protein
MAGTVCGLSAQAATLVQCFISFRAFSRPTKSDRHRRIYRDVQAENARPRPRASEPQEGAAGGRVDGRAAEARGPRTTLLCMGRPRGRSDQTSLHGLLARARSASRRRSHSAQAAQPGIAVAPPGVESVARIEQSEIRGDPGFRFAQSGLHLSTGLCAICSGRTEMKRRRHWAARQH